LFVRAAGGVIASRRSVHRTRDPRGSGARETDVETGGVFRETRTERAQIPWRCAFARRLAISRGSAILFLPGTRWRARKLSIALLNEGARRDRARTRPRATAARVSYRVVRLRHGREPVGRARRRRRASPRASTPVVVRVSIRSSEPFVRSFFIRRPDRSIDRIVVSSIVDLPALLSSSPSNSRGPTTTARNSTPRLPRAPARSTSSARRAASAG
jgi:hypothetical protein